MRFELNFVAVVNNVAVLANVVKLVADRFVAIYQPVHQASGGYGTTLRTGQMRPESSCDPCLSSSYRHPATMRLAYAVISPECEITKRWRHESLLTHTRG